MKKFACLIAAGVVISTGCQKQESQAQKSGSATGESATVVAAPLPIATHLGIATRIPADADLFTACYGVGEGMVEVFEPFLHQQEEGATEEKISESRAKIAEFGEVLGDEAFTYIGHGLGVQLETAGKSYRGFSAAWAEFAMGAALDALADKEGEPDLTVLEESLTSDLLERWMDVLEKDSQLQVPSIVMGWRPSGGKLEECREKLGEGFDSVFSGNEKAAPVSFESSGATMKGYEVSGRDVFGEAVEKIRTDMQEEEAAAELLEKFSPERIERVLVALENVRITIAHGELDGRVLIYLGNGKEGLRFAGKPEDSLAATDALKWTHGYSGKRVMGVSYFSELMVRSILPWLDNSQLWAGLSRAIRPPVKDDRLMRDLLSGMADIDRDLAARTAMAWSAVIVEDQGWRYESRGGWPDPALDYEAPLKMTDAAVSLQPAVRMHWVQDRQRKDREWDQVEQFGMLIEAVVGEIQASSPELAGMMPEDAVPRFLDEIRNLNAAYRDQFRAGIGDEVAFALDFKGEMPPVPGVAEETVANAKVPRFLVARPVVDRSKINDSGESFAKSWRTFTEWANELSGENYPLLLPQKLESGGLELWYPPLPFIGGDFVPGVALGDRVWMMGTSRSLSESFAKSMDSPASGGETGMIAEIDFAPIRAWSVEMQKLKGDDLDDLTGNLAQDQPEEIREASRKSLKIMGESFGKIQGLGYRKWLADGVPRTSLHLRTGE